MRGGVAVEDRAELREQVLEQIREERKRQLEMYGSNDDLEIGMGPDVKWLRPFSSGTAEVIARGFREAYREYEAGHANVTWMHLIKEEVSELFEAEKREDLITEAVQVAALCVSLVEHLLRYGDLDVKLSTRNLALLIRAYDDGDGGNLDLRQRDDGWVEGTFGGCAVYEGVEVDGVLYSISRMSGGWVTVAVGEELLTVDGEWFDSVAAARAYIKGLTRR